MDGDIEIADAPEGALLRAMGGDIRVGRAGGHVVARTMGGNIEIRTVGGSLDATTLGGNVDVRIEGASRGRVFEIHSVGGSVEVTVPANFSSTFEVELEQDDGGPDRRIISDVPLAIHQSKRERWFRRDARVLRGTGRVGSGDALVRISTIGSDILIRRRR